MSDNKLYPVITISREYYAGGRSIAKRISEALDIPWHDNDLTRLASWISGYSEEEVTSEGEEISKLESAMETILKGANFFTSSHDAINSAQQEAVLEYAKSPCIIVGRGANIILKQAGIKTFDVFLHADKEIRIKRTMEARGIDEASAKKYLSKHDEYREIYYKKYLGNDYSDSRAYTISFDTGVISYDECAEIIVKAVKGLE